MYVAVEKLSKFAIGGRMRTYTNESFISAVNEIKARVRPIHGEIHILRGDSHATHNSKAVRSYMADEQHRLQLSPPYVHEGVGDIESFFLWSVPSANSLLLAAPDLGEPHFAQALLFVIHASNHSIKKGSSPPSSPAMVYYSSTSFIGSGLHCTGPARRLYTGSHVVPSSRTMPSRVSTWARRPTQTPRRTAPSSPRTSTRTSTVDASPSTRRRCWSALVATTLVRAL